MREDPGGWLTQLRQDLSRLSPGAVPALTPDRLSPGERREVVTLFLDLEGFTSLSENLDHESVHSLVTGVMSVLSEIVAAGGGMVDKFEGDRMMALFGAISCSEDDCARAVRSAEAMLSAVSEISEALRRKDLHLGARVGMSFGGVTVAPDASGHLTAVGDEVNVASRLEQAAETGTILASSAVVDGCMGLFEWEDRGEIQVRGRSRPVRASLYRGRARQGGISPRFLDAGLPLLGREGELREALDFLGRPPDPPTGPEGFPRHRILMVSGGDGSGKSRFLEEILSGGDSLPGTIMLRGSGGSGAASLGWWDERVADDGREGEAPSDEESLLQMRMAARDTVRSLAGACDSLMLVIDDAHLLDGAVRETLGFILSNCQSPRGITVVATEGTACGGSTTALSVHANQAETLRLSLGPLGRDATESLLATFLGLDRPDDLPAGLASSVGESCAGNPRFILETASELLETGVLTRNPEGLPVLTGSPGARIPPSLSRAVRARFDRLPPESRKALQTASVLGRRFPLELIEKVAVRLDLPGICTGLASTVEDGILILEGGFVGVRDGLMLLAAGESLLRMNRQVIHAAAAGALEGMPKDLEGFAAMMCTHLEASGRHAEAAPWALEAGRAAVRAFSPDGAYEWALRAMDLAERLEDRSLRVEVLLGAGEVIRKVLFDARTDERCVPALETALEAARECGEDGSAPALLVALSEMRRRKGDVAGAVERIEQALALARDSGIPGREAEALSAMAGISMHTGDLEAACGMYARALELYEASDDHRIPAAKVNLAACLLMTDGMREAEILLEDLVRGDDASVGVRTRTRALTRLGVLRGRQDRVEESIGILQEALGLAGEIGDRSSMSMALGNLGVSACRAGDDELALRSYRRALALARELGNRRSEMLCLTNLASLHANRGELVQAEVTVREALDLGSGSGSRITEADNLALLGWIRLSDGFAAEAAELCRKAEDARRTCTGVPADMGWLDRLREDLGGAGGETPAAADRR